MALHRKAQDCATTPTTGGPVDPAVAAESSSSLLDAPNPVAVEEEQQGETPQQVEGQFQRRMTVFDMAVYGLVFMVPISPFAIYGELFNASGGMPAMVYVVGCIGMLFTALSYGICVNRFPYSGSVYSYVSHGMGKGIGFLAGWLFLLDYALNPVLLFVTAGSALEEVSGVIPLWAWCLIFLAFVTIVNFRGVTVTKVVNIIALVAEIIILGLFIAFGLAWIFTNPDSHGLTFTPVFNPAVQNAPLLIMNGVSIAVLSFIGFDGIATLSEEAKDGRKGPGKAMLWSLFLVSVMFFIQSWIAGCISPDGAAFKGDESNAFYILANIVGGQWMQDMCAIGLALSWGVFTALAAQTAVTRVLFAMGRSHALPSALSKLHPKYNTPYVATIFMAILTLVLVFVMMPLGTDGISVFVNFGALTAYFLINVCVVWYFWVKQREHCHPVRYLIFPILGMFVIGFAWVSLSNDAKMLGGIWFAIGLAYYLIARYGFKRQITMEEE